MGDSEDCRIRPKAWVFLRIAAEGQWIASRFGRCLRSDHQSGVAKDHAISGDVERSETVVSARLTAMRDENANQSFTTALLQSRHLCANAAGSGENGPHPPALEGLERQN